MYDMNKRSQIMETTSIHLSSGEEGYELSVHYAYERQWFWQAEWRLALWEQKELETPETTLTESQEEE